MLPNPRKDLEFIGSSYDDLIAFPADVRHEAGYQLDRVQQGEAPKDWKPMSTIGAGVCEIRLREADGAFRVVYVAKLERAVYVLHCFQKKTQKTEQRDIDVATKRYRQLLKELE